MQVDKIIVKTQESNYPIIIGNGAISLLKICLGNFGVNKLTNPCVVSMGLFDLSLTI